MLRLRLVHRRSSASWNARQLTSLPCSQPFNILFLGGDEFSCHVLRQLHEAKDVWQKMIIATQPDRRTGRRGRNLSISPLKLLGERLNLDVYTTPGSKHEFRTWKPPAPFYPIHEPGPPRHHLLVTASFGRILRESHLELFCSSRRLNVHPSLLPAYRGPAPIQHALINDEKETGVCIVEMLRQKAGIDSGDIWSQQVTPVQINVTYKEMRDILGKQGGELLVSVLRDMLSGKIVSTPQRAGVDVPRAPMILFDDTLVNPAVMTAEQVVRTDRAIQRPLIVRFRRERDAKDSTLVQLHGVSVIEADTVDLEPGTATYDPHAKRLVVGCMNGTFLGVENLKQENRKQMTAREWWNGVRSRFIKFN